MGTGKTSVGRALARRLGRPFLDTDELVEKQLGRPVAAVFAAAGEGAFREAERAAAAAAVRVPGAVVATGGGILGEDENVALLRRAGPLVCLTARPAVILARVGDVATRPLLAAAPDPRRAIERLLAERAPRYALADLQLDTSDLRLEEVVERICAALPSLFPARLTTSS